MGRTSGSPRRECPPAAMYEGLCGGRKRKLEIRILRVRCGSGEGSSCESPRPGQLNNTVRGTLHPNIPTGGNLVCFMGCLRLSSCVLYGMTEHPQSICQDRLQSKHLHYLCIKHTRHRSASSRCMELQCGPRRTEPAAPGSPPEAPADSPPGKEVCLAPH